jgi:DNA-3-methyladenine glycosylase I
MSRPKTPPPHELGGAHKRGVPYSSHRALRSGLAWEKGASQGKESILADSWREGEYPARVVCVGSLNFLSILWEYYSVVPAVRAHRANWCSFTLIQRRQMMTKRFLPFADGKPRCGWVGGKPHFIAYHDREWGVPVHDDRKHFEMLLLEGAQAGLTWETILLRRDGYRRAFAGFDPKKVARFTEKKKAVLLKNPGIIRNRLKIESAVTNAQAFLAVQEEFGSFDRYVWQFVGASPIVNHWARVAQVPATSGVSDALSKDLKKRGFRFVGSTIVYAYMQAVGLVNDHLADCFIHAPR